MALTRLVGANAISGIVPVANGGTGASSFTKGKVLQVITGTTSTRVESSSTTYADTGLSVTITPSSSSNKILIKGSLYVGQNYWQTRGRILRDSTAIGLGETAGSRIPVTWNNNTYDGSSNTQYVMNSVSFEFLDSPSTTSQITYSLDLGGYSTSYTVYLNRSHSDTDASTYFGRPISTLTLMEIAQ